MMATLIRELKGQVVESPSDTLLAVFSSVKGGEKSRCW
jgi:hypothetical protein